MRSRKASDAKRTPIALSSGSIPIADRLRRGKAAVPQCESPARLVRTTAGRKKIATFPTMDTADGGAPAAEAILRRRIEALFDELISELMLDIFCGSQPIETLQKFELGIQKLVRDMRREGVAEGVFAHHLQDPRPP
jgi:hypothetical protein